MFHNTYNMFRNKLHSFEVFIAFPAEYQWSRIFFLIQEKELKIKLFIFFVNTTPYFLFLYNNLFICMWITF